MSNLASPINPTSAKLDLTPVIQELYGHCLSAVKKAGNLLDLAVTQATSLVQRLWNWIKSVCNKVLRTAFGVKVAMPEKLTPEQAKGQQPTALEISAPADSPIDAKFVAKVLDAETKVFVENLMTNGLDLSKLKDGQGLEEYVRDTHQKFTQYIAYYDSQKQLVLDQREALINEMAKAAGTSTSAIDATLRDGNDGGLLDRESQAKQLMMQADAYHVASSRAMTSLQVVLNSVLQDPQAPKSLLDFANESLREINHKDANKPNSVEEAPTVGEVLTEAAGEAAQSEGVSGSQLGHNEKLITGNDISTLANEVTAEVAAAAQASPFVPQGMFPPEGASRYVRQSQETQEHARDQVEQGG